MYRRALFYISRFHVNSIRPLDLIPVRILSSTAPKQNSWYLNCPPTLVLLLLFQSLRAKPWSHIYFCSFNDISHPVQSNPQRALPSDIPRLQSRLRASSHSFPPVQAITLHPKDQCSSFQQLALLSSLPLMIRSVAKAILLKLVSPCPLLLCP